MSNSEYSPFKFAHHQDKIQEMKEGKQPVPLQTQIILSDLCSQSCLWCAYRLEGYTSNQNFGVVDPLTGAINNNPNRMIPYEKCIEIIDDCKEMGVKALQFSVWGEERIPVIKNGELKYEKISDFVNSYFDHPCGGYEAIDVKDNVMSYSHNDSGEAVLDNITHVYRHVASEFLYEITTKDGRNIFVTGSHSLFILRDNKIEKIKVKDLTLNDLIVSGDFSIPVSSSRKFHLRATKYKDEIIIDEEKQGKDLFRLLGYYSAEGSSNYSGYVDDRKDHAAHLTFTFNKSERDFFYIEDIKAICKNLFDYSPTLYDRPSSIQLVIGSVSILEFFLSIGALGRANKKSVPDIVFNTNNENKIEYLKGLFGGDGNYRDTLYKGGRYRRNTLCLKTASRSLCGGVFDILRSFDCYPTIIKGKNLSRKIEGRELPETDYYSLSVSNRPDLEKLSPIIEYVGGKIEYKVKYRFRFNQYEKFGDALLLPVKSIRVAEELGHPVVFDISVKTTHRFISGCGAISCANTGGGEPSVHPKHKEIFQYTLDSGLDLALVSNGVNWKPGVPEVLARAKWVRVSLDAARKDTYSSMRQCPSWHYDKAIENIKKLVAAKERIKANELTIGVGFVVSKENYTEIYEAALIIRDLGVDNMRISAVFTPNDFDYFKDFYYDASKEAGKAVSLQTERFKIFNLFGERIDDLKQHSPEYSFCGYMNLNTYIGGDQNIYRCCNTAYNDRGLIGSIKDRTFKDLWLSKEKQDDFNKFDAKGCERCMFNNKNRFINYLIDNNPKHVNYI